MHLLLLPSLFIHSPFLPPRRLWGWEVSGVDAFSVLALKSSTEATRAVTALWRGLDSSSLKVLRICAGDMTQSEEGLSDEH